MSGTGSWAARVKVGLVVAVACGGAIAVVNRLGPSLSSALVFTDAEVVSRVGADGPPYAAQSFGASMSADGTIVTFDASNPGVEFVTNPVAYRERPDQETFEVPDEPSSNGSISDDGCVIAHWAQGTSGGIPVQNLIAYDRCQGEPSVVDVGFPVSPVPPRPAVNADGSRIAIVVQNRISVYDLVDGAWEQVQLFHPFYVNVDLQGTVYGSLSISDDGALLAFAASPPAFGRIDVWIADLTTEIPEEGNADRFVLASFDADGMAPEGDSVSPSISGDGSLVAFASCNPALASWPAWEAAGGPLVEEVSIHVADWQSGTMRVAAAFGDAPALSQDGRHVAYVELVDSGACDGEGYFGDFGDARGDMYVATSTSAGVPFDAFQTDLVSYTTAGITESTTVARAAISAHGRWVAFDSIAGEALTGNVIFNDRDNVYVRERPPSLLIDGVDFGDVEVGQFADGVAVVTGNGLSGWIVTAIEATPGFSVLPGTTCPIVIHPGTTCTIPLRFAPTTEGLATGSVIVRDESYPDRPLSRVGRLTGRGVVTPPPTTTTVPPTTTTTTTTTTVPPPLPVFSLVAEPPALDFAPQTVGTSSGTQTVLIRNNGNVPNTLTGIGIGGPNPTDFAIVSTTCGGAVLAVNATCAAEIRFAPSAQGARTAILLAQGSGGSAAAATFTGTGTPPPSFALAIEPANVGFPFTAVGDASEVRTATVRNTGNVPNQVSSVAITGVLAGDYRVVSTTCTGVTLAVNGTCTVQLEFAPTDAGPRLATLVATGQGGSSGTAVLLGPSLFVPTLEPLPAVATVGQVVTIIGRDFPPNITVELEWEVTDETFTVETDDTGSFQVPMLVVVRNGLGAREIVALAQTDRFDEVLTELLLVPHSMQPQAAVMVIRNAESHLSR